MAHHAIAQLNLDQGPNPWKLNPKQLAKKRKMAQKRAEFRARQEASKPTGEIDSNEVWLPNEPEPVPREEPKWADDPYNKTQQMNPAQQEKERIEHSLRFWPWRHTIPRHLITLAPYLLNELREPKPGQPFSLSEVKQECLLFEKLLSNDLIRQKIAELLFQNHDTASKFAATSRQSWRVITYDTSQWDFTRGWFGNCQIPREQFDKDNLIAEAIQGSVPSVIIVSPVRGPNVYPKDIEQKDELPWEDHTKLYGHQVRSMHRMCLAMSNFADFFRNLQIHRLPFLTTNILELIIPMMRNLKVLGVYKCQLIHIGDTMKLLEIIQTDKPKGKDTQISLDFYPNYHVGPISVAGRIDHVGSYGVTWDNWNGDTRLGVWQLISIIIPQAQKQKQDFLSKHTMFRQWLDKSPCWRVEETLATLIRDVGDTRTDEEIDEDFVVMCDAPNTSGRKSKFKSKVSNRPEGYQWMLERHPCQVCGLNPLGIFYYYDDIRQSTNQGLMGSQLSLKCLGCRLTGWLDQERDHYKRYKRSIIEAWVREPVDDGSGEPTYNTNNMSKFLSDFKRRGIARRALKLDALRNKEMKMEDNPDPLDRENDEVQVPLNDNELGRLGMKNRSPTIDSKDSVFDPWNAIDTSRKWAHGHGIPH